MTKEEKQQLGLWHRQRALFQEELEELRSLRDDPAHPKQADLEEEITKTEKVLEIVDLALASGSIPDEFPPLQTEAPSFSSKAS